MIPKKLKKDPLIEVLWELRFETEPNFAKIIPGILFSRLKNKYSNLVINKLPAESIPAEIKEIDPNLRYAPSLRIEVMDIPLIWQMGERVFTYNNKKPYLGWNRFVEEIKFLSGIFEEINLFKSIEKISLRYIDLIEKDIFHDLSDLKVSINIDKWEVKDEKISLLVEKFDGGFKNIIQVARPMDIVMDNRQISGTIIDIEVELLERGILFNELINRNIDAMHYKAKEIFFDMILKDSIINKLEPEW